MNILVAIDSFKGSLSSLQAGRAVQDAAEEVIPNGQVIVRPLADGGEGTVEALASGLGGERVSVCVSGPLGDPINAQYCILPDGTAVMEIAAAAGITLIPHNKRNPLETSTYGVGEMIRHAISRGCRRFIVGLGGSATNDGGTGMLSALGFAFQDSKGQSIPLGGKGLEQLASIDSTNALPQLAECSFRVACDVTNPLCGNQGCSAVFGPQKGADTETVAKMDQWLSRYGALSGGNPDFPGAGAAGGLGFAFLTFLGGSLEPGIQIILEETHLEVFIRDADLVITGEGRLDSQTAMGKAPIGVAQLAKKHGKKVIAFCGCIGEGAQICNDYGIDAYFPIVPGVVSLEDALKPENAYCNLKNTAQQVFRLLSLHNR